jgi:hypothetical protein
MYWMKRLFHKERIDGRLDNEIRFHLEERAAERLCRSGSGPG